MNIRIATDPFNPELPQMQRHYAAIFEHLL